MRVIWGNKRNDSYKDVEVTQLFNGCKTWNYRKHLNLDKKNCIIEFEYFLTKEYLNSDLVMALFLKEHT